MLELPLSAVRSGRTRTRMERRGISFETDAYVVDEHLIWGATARILEHLLERLRQQGPAADWRWPSSAPARSGCTVGLPHSVQRAVVVLDLVVAEQLVQHEPRVRGALADAAVGDDVLAVEHALAGVQLAQLLSGLERAVLAAPPAPTGPTRRPGCARRAGRPPARSRTAR